VAGSGNRSIELSVTPENFTQANKDTTNAGLAGSGNRSIELPVFPKRSTDGFLSKRTVPSETLGTGRGGAVETRNRSIEVSAVPRSLLLQDAPSETLGIRRSGAIETGNRSIEVSVVPRLHFRLTSAFEATQWLTLVFAASFLALMHGFGRRWHNNSRHQRDDRDDRRPGTAKEPPRWSPALQRQGYPLHRWVEDLAYWNLELPPDMLERVRAIRIMNALSDPAYSMIREHLNLEVLTQGARSDPNDPHSPVLEPQTYIISLLYKHYGQFDQEVRRLADETFTQLGPVMGESFEELVSRYDVARRIQEREGIRQWTWEEHTRRLLMLYTQMDGVIKNEFLRARRHRLPQTQREFDTLVQELRDESHIRERRAGNLQADIVYGRDYELFAPDAQYQIRRAQGSRGQRNMYYNEQDDVDYDAEQQQTLLAQQQPTFQRPVPTNTYMAPAVPATNHSTQPFQLGDEAEFPDIGSFLTTNKNAPQDFASISAFMTENTTTNMDDSSSATSSDNGSALEDAPDDADPLTKAFYAYRKGKRNWRRMTGKPVRKYRRAFRFYKFKKQRHSGSRREPRRTYLAGAWNEDEWDFVNEHVFFGGKGKGKGFGRKGNPSTGKGGKGGKGKLKC
jgi:hypothetical protein